MRQLRTTAALVLTLGLMPVSRSGADSPDSIKIVSQEAWSCSRVIGIKPFALAGKFKGEQPQQAYMRLLLTGLSSALRAAHGVQEVVEVSPGMTATPDLMIEGEFLELNTGNRAARFWVGMGAGKSKCAVQVRGYTHPAHAPVFDVRHERISAMGLDSDELAENVQEVARDIGVALASARQGCAAPPPVVAVAANATEMSPAADGTGVFAIESEPPGAEVYVNGEFLGTTPIASQALPAGKHEIELRKKGRSNWTRKLRVSAGTRATISAELEPASPAGEP
jgi:hypothetical protein